MRPHVSRRTILAVGASGALSVALAGGAVAPWGSRIAEAQVDPVLPEARVVEGQPDPALAATDQGLAETGLTDASVAVPATPVMPPEPPVPAPTWESSDAGMSTSLGGSDIAVASEGGSHEVDAPKRKANKILGGSKRP